MPGAPRAWASGMAVTPMPLLPPCTSRVSPACKAPRSNTLLQTVKKVSGNADRKSTRLNSSHLVISYAVFCLKKKKTNEYDSHCYHCARRDTVRPHRTDLLLSYRR